MNSRFVIYDGKPNARAIGPQVTVSRDGRFSFNKVATAILDKHPVQKILLGWEASTNTIAMIDIVKKDARARTIRYGKDGRGAAFNAKDFLEGYVGYDLSRGRSFPAEWDAEEGTLTFQVDPTHIIKSKRNASAMSISHGKKMQQA